MPEELLRPNYDGAENQIEDKRPAAKVRKKRSLGGWLSSVLRREGDSFLYHVLYGILAPRTVDAVDDILKDGIDRMLRPRGSRYENRARIDQNRYDGVSYRDYNSMYETPATSQRYEPMARFDSTPDPRTIEFRDRYEALKVLEDMKEAIYAERFCTIQQFYEFVRRHTGINIMTNHTDEHWGWSNLADARPEMSYNGRYVLRLPRTEEL